MSQIDPEENSLSREFEGPTDLSEMDRREFFRYLGLFSSMTLLASCSKKASHIFPFINEEKAFATHNFEFYSSAFPAQGYAQGILVKSFQGRPIKIEGNPEHPYSLGATSAQAQSAIYELYHPGRLTTALINKKKVLLEDVRGFLIDFKPEQQDGRDLAFVMPALQSPHLLRLMRDLQKKYPASLWICASPWNTDVFTTYELSEVKTLLSFDEDLFSQRPDSLRLSRSFMARRVQGINKNSPTALNRLLAVSSSPNLLAAKADDWLKVPRSQVWNSAIDLLDELEGKNSHNSFIKKHLSSLKRDSLVVIDPTLHPDARLLEAAINGHLLAKGKTWKTKFAQNTSVHEAQNLMKDGKIKSVFLLDSEFTIGRDWNEALKKVPRKISLSLFPNETTKKSEIIIPASHWLEAWGDISTPEGVLTIQQPLIEPLYPTLSIPEVLSLLLGDRTEVRDQLKTHWSKSTNWEKLLNTGVLKTAAEEFSLSSKKSFSRKNSPRWELTVRPDPSIGFGESADNPVLQELPKPFTRLTWGNVFLLSTKEARDLKISDGEKIRVTTDQGHIQGPVMVSSLMPDNSLFTTAGYGKKSGTDISKDRGFSAYILRERKITSVEKIRGNKKLARVQISLDMDGHPPVETAILPLSPQKKKKSLIQSLYPESPIPSQDTGPQWAMTIDLTTCIGCEACVASCQMENNIPFVGEDQVHKRRELHWLRIDNYVDKDRVFFQPVLCMHCEKAPCEVVCPVNATVHGDGGLNEMIYNRCVGTRYCSNNCPYKVRRFNFKAYSSLPKPWNLGFNPDVSVRDRGVMEKCTYCIQRIKFGQRNKEEVRTACQSVCPTEAIVFGNLKDENSLLVKNKKLPRNYDLLEEEGTRPRTSYLKVIRGPV